MCQIHHMRYCFRAIFFSSFLQWFSILLSERISSWNVDFQLQSYPVYCFKSNLFLQCKDLTDNDEEELEQYALSDFWRFEEDHHRWSRLDSKASSVGSPTIRSANSAHKQIIDGLNEVKSHVIWVIHMLWLLLMFLVTTSHWTKCFASSVFNLCICTSELFLLL